MLLPSRFNLMAFPSPMAWAITVKEVGAKGDGKADDTAIIKAITEAGKRISILDVGEGTSIFPPALTLLPNP